ncbi:hypothetical protein ACQV2B_04165 [Pantoea allii]|uniref:hypothetical protein n=1 Tax=Pantoea allii TaxID=574096 RepID=UPI003D321BC4
MSRCPTEGRCYLKAWEDLSQYFKNARLIRPVLPKPQSLATFSTLPTPFSSIPFAASTRIRSTTLATVSPVSAVNLRMEIPVRKRPEIALVHLGAFMDGGMNADMFPLSFFEEIFERYPQEGNKAHFIELVANVLTKKPHTAYLTFENDIGIRRVKDYHPLNYCDKKPAYPFNR